MKVIAKVGTWALVLGNGYNYDAGDGTDERDDKGERFGAE